MSSTAMALWSAGGAATSASSPLNRMCSQCATAANASSSFIKASSFYSNTPKAAWTATTATIMAKTRSVVSTHAPLSLGGVGPNCGLTSMIIGIEDGTGRTRSFGKIVSCEVILRSNNFRTPALSASSSSTTTTSNTEEKEGEGEVKKLVGARVRVKVPLKVYHVPRVPEVDLTGLEGHLKQYVALWKGKRISANLPYKVEFVVDVQGRGPVKFLAHLKEGEFECLD